jgi:hypothetical protein
MLSKALVLAALLTLLACSSGADNPPGSVGQPCNPNAEGDGCDSSSVCITETDICYSNCANVSCLKGSCEDYQSQLEGDVSVCVPDGMTLPEQTTSNPPTPTEDAGGSLNSVADPCGLIGTWSRASLAHTLCSGESVAASVQAALVITANDVAGKTFALSNDEEAETCTINETNCTMLCTVTAFVGATCLADKSIGYNFSARVEESICPGTNCACTGSCSASLSKE